MPTSEVRVPIWTDQARALRKDRRWPRWRDQITSGDPEREEQGLANVFWWLRVTEILMEPENAEVLADVLLDPRPMREDVLAENVAALGKASAGRSWERDDD